MKKHTLDKIIASLIEQKGQLLSKLSKVSAEVDIDIDGDEIDEIQGSLIASISSQLSFRDSQKLLQIQNALQRIEEGNFGTCENCEEQISEKRLEVNPYFTTCISCAEERELVNKRR